MGRIQLLEIEIKKVFAAPSIERIPDENKYNIVNVDNNLIMEAFKLIFIFRIALKKPKESS